MERKEGIDAYYQLRDSIDKRSVELSSMHSDKLACKKGCDSCCENIKVFPLEFEAIQNELGLDVLRSFPRRNFNRFRKSCTFLVGGACSIYNSRPIICRTQGLPLLYQNAEGTAYELSVCHLNFKGISPDKFSMDNALYMPKFNSQLYMLNQVFIKNKMYKENQRIALYELIK